MQTVFCLFGVHNWVFGGDEAYVRDQSDDHRRCHHCRRVQFWADGQWMFYPLWSYRP